MALAQRMDAIEARVRETEAEQAQMREEWRVIQQAPFINGQVLRSLRQTQIEHGQQLTEHGQQLTEHDRQLDELRQGMGTIVGMLTTLIERDEGDR